MVTVNGNTMDLAGKTIADYLSETHYDVKRIAVEMNGEIIPKADYATTLFKDGDTVEVVSFVGGG